MPIPVGHVAQLWRYPVKSLAGEPLPELLLNRRGAEFDRLWALVDEQGGIASGKHTRRFRRVPGLLRHAGRMEGDLPAITLADGRRARIGTLEAQRLLDEIAGPGWSVQRERTVPHFDAAPIHLVTASTLAALNAAVREPVGPERLRPNLVLDTPGLGFLEDAWRGSELRIGAVRLRVVERTERCVMVNQGQRELPERRDVLKAIGRLNAVCAGVYAEVLEPGAIRLRDPVLLG